MPDAEDLRRRIAKCKEALENMRLRVEDATLYIRDAESIVDRGGKYLDVAATEICNAERSLGIEVGLWP